MNLAFYRKGKLHYSILYLLAFIGLGLLWQYVFRIAFHQNYVRLCLAFGPSVLIFNALITAIWSDFNDDTDLVSANPTVFVGAWLFVGATISIAFANAARRPYFLGEDAPAKWDQVRENISHIIVFYILLVLVYVWLLCAMPFLYFVFLLSASPVRMALAVKGAGLTYHPELVLKENGTEKERHASFSEKPVTSAFALGSLMTLAISLIARMISLLLPS